MPVVIDSRNPCPDWGKNEIPVVLSGSGTPPNTLQQILPLISRGTMEKQ